MSSKDPIRIEGRSIGPKEPPFLVAEMSGNHHQSLDRALAIVEAAAKAGAHAIKLQTYTPDTMTIDLREREFMVSAPGSLWRGTSLYELYSKAYTPWEWHEDIFIRARQLGIIPFSTPFDDSAVEFLEKIGAPCYKIASFENTDLSLIQRVSRTGKPVVISTGMATLQELDEAVSTAREAGCKDLVLLKCTSTYPASPVDTHLATIPYLRDRYDCQVGLSDHSMGVGVAVASVAVGATFIEKHFTLSRAEGGVDSAFSMEPVEWTSLVDETERAWQAMGEVRLGPLEAEEDSRQFRRSLYLVEDVRAGEPLTEKNMRRIRPGYGLPTKHYESLLGRRVVRDAPRGTALSWDLLEE